MEKKEAIFKDLAKGVKTQKDLTGLINQLMKAVA